MAITIQEVQADSTLVARTDATQSDVLTTAGNGNIVLQTLTGSITLNDGTASADNMVVSADGTGNLLIEAADAAGDITVNADLLSGQRLHHGARRPRPDLHGHGRRGDLRAATLDLVAGTGRLTQDDNSRFVTTSGDIRLSAWLDILLGGLTTTGRASLTSVIGRILDSGDEFGDEDVVAFSLRAVGGTGIGEPDNHLETRVTVMAARSSYFGIYLLETDGVIVDEAYATVWQVGADATMTAVYDAGMSDLRAEYGNGNIVLQTLDGDIILNDGSLLGYAGSVVSASGTGSILIESLGAGRNIAINANIDATYGNISVRASGSIVLTEDVELRTNGDGTIQLVAAAGAIQQDDTSRIISQFGDIWLEAQTGILLGGVTTSATWPSPPTSPRSSTLVMPVGKTSSLRAPASSPASGSARCASTSRSKSACSPPAPRPAAFP